MTILNLFKKTAFLGIGIASLTEEKISEIIYELEKKGELSSQEGKDIINKLCSNVEKERNEAENKLRSIIESYTSKIKPASKEDIMQLEKRIQKLEKELSRQEKAGDK